mmetsp:Transcript_26637/g.57511  ORF Transcript_26637/g.57511 Transcript_26637/m.57511 type:complete len:252 (+) Transcript_26637:1095-1850(+)
MCSLQGALSLRAMRCGSTMAPRATASCFAHTASCCPTTMPTCMRSNSATWESRSTESTRSGSSCWHRSGCSGATSSSPAGCHLRCSRVCVCSVRARTTSCRRSALRYRPRPTRRQAVGRLAGIGAPSIGRLTIRLASAAARTRRRSLPRPRRARWRPCSLGSDRCWPWCPRTEQGMRMVRVAAVPRSKGAMPTASLRRASTVAASAWCSSMHAMRLRAAEMRRARRRGSTNVPLPLPQMARHLSAFEAETT